MKETNTLSKQHYQLLQFQLPHRCLTAAPFRATSKFKQSSSKSSTAKSQTKQQCRQQPKTSYCPSQQHDYYFPATTAYLNGKIYYTLQTLQQTAEEMVD